MSTKNIYKVFVSSTYEDLREERSAIQKALLQLNCFPVGMELFPAADDETWDFIKSQIDDSDYYVVVVAGRYGSLAPDGLSFTEKEYDYALSKKKPIIGFVHSNPGSIAANRTDALEPAKSKLAAFLDKIKRRPVRPFSDARGLALEVTISFVQLIRDRPAVGYVRTDEVVDYKRYAEILEENNSLKEQLKLAESSITAALFPAHNRLLSLTILIEPAPQQVIVQRTVGEAFEAIGEAALQQTEEKSVLRDAALRLVDRPVFDVGFDSESLKALRRELLLYDLIEITSDHRSKFSKTVGTLTTSFTIWRLTDYGRRQLSAIANRTANLDREPDD